MNQQASKPLGKFKLLMNSFTASYNRYEKWMPLFFFLGGFFFDVATLGRIDDTWTILNLTLYMLISLSVVLMDLSGLEYAVFKNPLLRHRHEAYHFCMGALLSAFTLFFFKSSSSITSLIFVFTMGSFLVVNEMPHFRKTGIHLKLALVQLALLCFSFMLIPQLIGQVGLLVFLFSLSIGLGLYLFPLYIISKKWGVNFRKNSLPGIVVSLVFLFLYIFKAIPPVPLSLQKIGIYHNVEKHYPEYHLYYKKDWWNFWSKSPNEFLARDNDKIFLFVRVFSPGGFQSKIYLHWQYFHRGKWLSSDRLPLTINGGRSKGYRGYAFKENYTPGEWKVTVETSRKVEIGSHYFTIKEDKSDNIREMHLEIDR